MLLKKQIKCSNILLISQNKYEEDNMGTLSDIWNTIQKNPFSTAPLGPYRFEHHAKLLSAHPEMR